MDKKLLVFILAAVALVIVAGVGGYYLGYQKGYGKGYVAGVETGRAAAKTGAGAAVTNPLENMPETNPFEKVINPFEAGYINPFK